MSLIAKLRAIEAARAIAASGAAAPADAPADAPIAETAAEPSDAPAVDQAEAHSPRLSPARRHRQRVMASLGARSIGPIWTHEGFTPPQADNDAPMSTEEAHIRLQLIDHQRSLKATMSTKGKEAMKREFLPLYEGWVDGVLASNAGRNDDVLTTIMVWRMDVGDFVGAMPIIEYVLKHNLQLPDRFKSTAPVFITDTICDAALKAFALGDEAADAFPSGILGHLEDLVDDIDMHDEVRAKLQKAIGKAILQGGDEADRRSRAGEALRRYLKALDMDERVGLKKDIDSLKRELKRSEPGDEPPADQAPSDETPAEDPPAEQSAPEPVEQNASDTPSDDG